MPFIRIEHAGAAVVTSLASDITSGATSIALTGSSGWPTGATGPFYVVIDPGLVGEEKILATARSSNTLTGCTRGVDGTAQAAHTAGAVVEHVFVATEADEANQAAHQTLGAVTSKGDMLAATGTNALARVAAGANGTVLVADTSQATGTKFGTLTSTAFGVGSVTNPAIAAGSVTGTSIANNVLTEAKFSSAFWHRQSFSVAAAPSGAVTIPHGAAFTPTMCLFMFTAPVTLAGTNNGIINGLVVTSIDATNVVIKTNVDNTATVAGQVLSLA